MPTFLDIIGSLMIGGMIILIVMNANILTTESWQVYNNTMLAQEMLLSTAALLEGEMRNMGYNVDPTVSAVLDARDTSITFLTDLNRNGVPDEVRYWLGPLGELNVQNELMRVLYRSTSLDGHVPHGVGFVTSLRFRYIRQQGDTLTTPVSPDELSQVHEVEIAIEVQNPYGVYRDPATVGEGERDAIYSTSFWRQTRLASKNLRRGEFF